MFTFFRELEFNIFKDWFSANRGRYEASVKKPMEAFGNMNSSSTQPLLRERS